MSVQIINNLRKHKRYEVSFSATFRKIDDIIGGKYSIVNNVSLSGMSIITRDKLCKGDKIELNIKCTGACFVTIDCAVMWVTQSEQSYFCGLSISCMDDKNKALYKNLIKNLQSSEKRKTKKIEKNANALNRTMGGG